MPVAAQTVQHKIDLPKDSPVGLLSADFGNSSTTTRGGASLVDVRASLSLRNSTQKKIRGITLAVYAQQVTPGGKGSVSVPSLNVAPGEAFSVRIDMPLLRPLAANAEAPSVEVKLDGVLFDDLSFYGPDTLNSQRSMTTWELQARRDRDYFKGVLASQGAEALGREMLAGLSRQQNRPGARMGVRMARGRATNAEPGHEVKFTFVEIPNSPVEPLDGTAMVSDRQASAPRFRVRNRSGRAVNHLEIGWIMKNAEGDDFLAASMPADLKLAPQQDGQVREEAELRFNKPIATDGASMAGYISSVEFDDGSLWIPNRSALALPRLQEVVPPSPEEQRLMQIYRKNGLDALITELEKF